MRGLALHANLTGAKLVGEVTTAPRYRLYSIADRHPGMFEVVKDGVAVAGELYAVSPPVLERVQMGEPPDLYLGPVQLADGRTVQGILYPQALAEEHHRDISAYGGWRAYIARDVTDTKPGLERYGDGLATDRGEGMLRTSRGE
jgi:gamma-glutamylcyclotransferase (GGCT)/AIG2-like uncharacterized protein YtfP